MNLQLFAAGGAFIARLYDFVDGQKVYEYHLDNEFNQVVLWINGKIGNVNIATDADIDGSKLKIATIPIDRLLEGAYTKVEVDTKMANAALGTVPDRSVDGIKLKLDTVTSLEIAVDAALKTKLGLDKIIRIGHTWGIAGSVLVAAGDTDYIVPYFVSVATGQTAKLAKARFRINSGTSVSVKLQKNGVDIAGYTALSITPATSEVDAADVTLADNDTLSLVVTAVVGGPKNMSVTLFIDHYV
jgi:hypothetical protein